MGVAGSRPSLDPHLPPCGGGWEGGGGAGDAGVGPDASDTVSMHDHPPPLSPPRKGEGDPTATSSHTDAPAGSMEGAGCGDALLFDCDFNT